VYGDTALHDAARFGHITTVQLLMTVTDRTIKNRDGKDVLEVAAQYAQHKVINLLIQEEKSKL
jgi:ankyrin repeat protein